MSYSLLPKELLEYYEDLGKELGVGGFAKVILARHIGSGVLVAIKVIEKNLMKDDANSVECEVSVLKKLKHQNICKLFQVYEAENHAYIVMEYLHGGELYDLIVSTHHLTELEARRIFRQVLSAIGYLHSMGVAHRDLKPENILLDNFKNVRLIDFGLSANPTGGLIYPLESLCGSFAYVAPEILCGNSYFGNEADIWSLGVLLFTLLCGYLPFEEAKTMDEVIENIKKGIYFPAPHVSKDARNLLCCMLEPDPKKRSSVWSLAEHKWVNHGFNEPVNWTAAQENVNLDSSLVGELSTRYNIPHNDIVDMIAKGSFNEITAHYNLMMYKRGLTGDQSCCFPETATLNGRTCGNAVDEELKPGDAGRLVSTLENHCKENVCGGVEPESKILSSNIDEKLKVAVKKVKNVTEVTPQKDSDVSVLRMASTDSSKSVEDGSSRKSKKKGIARILGLFSHMKNCDTTPSSPRTLKTTMNVRIAANHTKESLLSCFQNGLHGCQLMGDLKSFKSKNFVFKCEKCDVVGKKVVFTLEICRIMTKSSMGLGILSKRIKGNSQLYKNTVKRLVDKLLYAKNPDLLPKL